MNEAELLRAARANDEHAFARLTEPYARALHAHCYRMLASVADAEDAVQETLLRAWRNLARFEGRSSLRSWLYAIATNVCLRMIERRPARVLPIDYGKPADPHESFAEPLVESTWIEPYPHERHGIQEGLAGPEARYEQRESIELSFIAALQYLPPRQRAVLILRDVLGFSGSEVAQALQTTPAGVYSALQRAHDTIDRRLPDRSQQATLSSLADTQLRELTSRYVEAWERSDIDAILAMLTEDAVLAMPPIPTWYRGLEGVRSALQAGPVNGKLRWSMTPTYANGQVAFQAALWDPMARAFSRHSLAILSLRGERIEQICAFHGPDAPAELESL
jgi:RNA polymerase sigma-70 factor (ECF subfamily)